MRILSRVVVMALLSVALFAMPGVAAADIGCQLTRDGSTVTLSFDIGGARPVIRRSGKFIAKLDKGDTTFVDSNAPAAATYLVRFRPNANEVVDTPCVDANPDINQVILVSIDGLRVDHITPGLMPRLSGLVDTGASTMNARTDPSQTKTLPNHISMFTGRFVWGAGGHRTTFNEDPGAPTTIEDTARVYVPSVFDVVDDNGGTTILYAGKTKFDYIERSYLDKLDTYIRRDAEGAVTDFVADVAAGTGPTFAFFHMRYPDSAGHAAGWGSGEYRAAVTQSDTILGDILDQLDAAGLTSTTTVIVTADHGGVSGAFEHARTGQPENYTVPFIVAGAGVSGPSDLYDLNPVYQDPGLARINKDGPQPIRSHDAANLSLDLLDLPALESPARNADQGLVVR